MARNRAPTLDTRPGPPQQPAPNPACIQDTPKRARTAPRAPTLDTTPGPAPTPPDQQTRRAIPPAHLRSRRDERR
jgi:hypothetical protein